jgi:galactitol PTS system EIIC component
MNTIVMTLKTVFDWLLSLNNYVLMPVIIFLIATLWFKVSVNDAFRSSLRIAIGFVGLSMLVGFLISNLSPAVQDMVKAFGFHTTTIDAGLSTSLLIAFNNPSASFYILVCILMNLILLATRGTKTINIDIWNFWHFAFIGGMVYFVTQNLWYTTLAIALSSGILLVMADITQPLVEKFFDLPGISIPHGSTTPLYFLAWPFAKLVDMIPGLKNVEVTPESIQKRLGAFGEPAVMGLVLGIILGILARWPINKILPLGVVMSGVFFLLTRIIGILVEGLMPIAEAAKIYLRKRYKDREIFIGLDSAILIGHPSVMAVSLLMMPITLLLALVLPGNQFLPFADLVFFPFAFAFIVAANKGNIVKSVIVSIPVIIITLYTSTWIAKWFTPAALAAGMPALQTGQMASNMFDGGFPLPFIFSWLFANIVGAAGQGQMMPLIITVVVLVAFILVASVLAKRSPKVAAPK